MFPNTSLLTCRTQQRYPKRNFDTKCLIRNSFSERPNLVKLECRDPGHHLQECPGARDGNCPEECLYCLHFNVSSLPLTLQPFAFLNPCFFPSLFALAFFGGRTLALLETLAFEKSKDFKKSKGFGTNPCFWKKHAFCWKSGWGSLFQS